MDDRTDAGDADRTDAGDASRTDADDASRTPERDRAREAEAPGVDDTSDPADAAPKSSEADESSEANKSSEADEFSDPGTSDPAFAGADDPLVVGALATFHTAVLVAALVAGLYLAGPLGELLGGLQTALGLGFYLALWATTWWTNRRWLGVVADPETDASTSVVVGTGGKWGSLNGVYFFWVLFVVTLIQIGELELGALLFFFVAWAVGSLLALGIGGIVGALFAALDAALFRVARRLVPESAAGREDSNGGP